MKAKLVVAILLLSYPLVAQEDTTQVVDKKAGHHKRKKKTHNILDYSDVLNVKFFGIRKSNLITHHDGLTETDIRYKPNENVNLGMGLGYKWLELDLAFNFKFINKDDHVFGETKRLDIQTNLYLHKFVLDINLQSYRGYYGSNPARYDDSFNKNNPTYPIRSDISTSNIGFSSFYIFNHERFSYRAAFNFNEKQKRSAGSFISGVYFDLYRMNADSTVVPYAIRDTFEEGVDFRGVNYANMGVSVGYAHTFVLFKHFFVSGTVALGLGPQSEKRDATDDLPEVDESGLGSMAIFRGSIGYSTNHYFAGLTAVRVITGNEDADVSHLVREVSNFKFVFGVRLVPPKFLR